MIRTTRYKLEYFINNNKLLQIRKENVQISIDLVYVEKKKKKRFYTLRNFSETGPSFSEVDSSLKNFSNPLLMACISSAKNFNCIWIEITNFSQEVATLQSFLNDSHQKQIRIPLMQAPSWQGHWKNLKLLGV